MTTLNPPRASAGRLLPMDSFGAAAPLVMLAVNSAFAFAGPVFDLLKLKRIHPAYYWGVGAFLIFQLLIPVLGFAPPTLALVHAIRGY